MKFPVIVETEADWGWSIPKFEGIYVDRDAKQWRRKLDGYEGKITELLSMPTVGINDEKKSRVVIFEDQYSNYGVFSTDEAGLIKFEVEHEYNRLQKNKQYAVRFHVGEKDLLAPAKGYRGYLKDSGQFVSMKDKIEKLPKAKRLIGAIHGYVWGPAVVYGTDINSRKAKPLIRRLVAAGESGVDEPAKWVWEQLNKEEKKTLKEAAKSEWVYAYQKNMLAAGIDRIAKDRKLQNTKAFGEYTSRVGELRKEASVAEVVKGNFEVLNSHLGMYLMDMRNGVMEYLLE